MTDDGQVYNGWSLADNGHIVNGWSMHFWMFEACACGGEMVDHVWSMANDDSLLLVVDSFLLVHHADGHGQIWSLWLTVGSSMTLRKTLRRAGRKNKQPPNLFLF